MESFDCRNIADVAAEALLDRPISYINKESEALRHDLIAYGNMPEWLASYVVEIQEMSVAIPEKPSEDI